MNITDTIKRIKKSRLKSEELYLYDIFNNLEIKDTKKQTYYFINDDVYCTYNKRTKTLYYKDGIYSYLLEKYNFDISQINYLIKKISTLVLKIEIKTVYDYWFDFQENYI